MNISKHEICATRFNDIMYITPCVNDNVVICDINRDHEVYTRIIHPVTRVLDVPYNVNDENVVEYFNEYLYRQAVNTLISTSEMVRGAFMERIQDYVDNHALDVIMNRAAFVGSRLFYVISSMSMNHRRRDDFSLIDSHRMLGDTCVDFVLTRNARTYTNIGDKPLHLSYDKTMLYDDVRKKIKVTYDITTLIHGNYIVNPYILN